MCGFEVREPVTRRDRRLPASASLDFPKPVGHPGLKAQSLLGALAAVFTQDRLACPTPVRHFSSWRCCFLGLCPISFGAFISEQICFFLSDSVEAEADTGDRWMLAITPGKSASKEGTERLQLKLSLSLELVESTENQLRVPRLWDCGSPDRGETGTAQKTLLFLL